MIWLRRIADKSIPLSDYKNASRSWRTCAIGEARQAVGTSVVVDLGSTGVLYDPENGPKDHRLESLGLDFHEAVTKNQRSRALRIYLAIQTRIARLAGVRG